MKEKKYLLKNLYIYLSWNCNLSCKHCWVNYKNEQTINKVISYEIIEKSILESIKLGLKNVKISGGEPLLYKKILKKIITLNTENNIFTSIETNGLLLDEDFTQFCVDKKVLICLSLDSTDEKTHNIQRNNSIAFNSTINALNLLDKYDVPYNVTMSTFTASDSEILKMKDLLSSHKARGLKINIIVKEGNAVDNYYFITDSVFSVSAKRMLEIYQTHCIRNDGIPTYIMVPYPYSGFFKRLSNKYNNCDYVYTGCNPLSLLSILPNGDVCLCADGHRNDMFLFGNVINDKIENIWNYSKNLINFRNQILYQLDGICRDCLAKNICYGGCRVVAYSQFGKVNAPHPICQELENEGLFFLKKRNG